MIKRTMPPYDRHRWREWPLVVLSLSDTHAEAKLRIVTLARELCWRVLDLQYHGGDLPPGAAPSGAFVESLWGSPLVRKLQDRNCPVVRFGRFANPHDHELPAVIEDYPMAGRMAAEHFAEHKFRHVGFVGYAPMSDYTPLYDGFRTRADELGMNCHLLEFQPLVDPSMTPGVRQRHREREFVRWIRQMPKPLGLLGITNPRAAAYCALCLEAGIDVPGEVAVLGRGSNPVVCECAPVPLSTVDQGGGMHGAMAVQVLSSLMAGEPPPLGTVFVPPRGVVLRQSTDTLGTADPVVQRAVRFIWDNIEKNLSVNDIALATGVVRRTIERAFHNEIGRGVAAEMSRRRMERCCELLRNTNLTVAQITPLVGFRSKDYLHTAFRRVFNTTPRQYRLWNCPKSDRAPRSGDWD